MQKTNQEEFRIEKVINRKGNNLYVESEGYDNLFNSWNDKKDIVYIKSVNTFLSHITILEETLMSKRIYATQTDLKNATGVDTSKLAAKSNLASFKAKIDKIDVDKFKTISVDLSKLNNAVNNDFAKKTLYDKLVSKVNDNDTSGSD